MANLNAANVPRLKIVVSFLVHFREGSTIHGAEVLAGSVKGTDLERRVLTVGWAKTSSGTGRQGDAGRLFAHSNGGKRTAVEALSFARVSETVGGSPSKSRHCVSPA